MKRITYPQIEHWCLRRPWVLFGLIVAIVDYLALLPISGLIDLIPSWAEAIEEAVRAIALEPDSLLEALGSIAVLGPILETLFLQLAPIELLRPYTKRPHLIVGIPTLLFACLHYYHIAYIIAMLFSGFVFAYAYWRAREERGIGYAFWGVALGHGLANALSLIIIWSDK